MRTRACTGGAMRRSLVALGLLLLAAPAAASGALRVHVAGGELRDGHGRIVMLRGVNVPWGLRVPGVVDRPPVRADHDAAQIASLGFNLARLQLSWKGIEP